MVRKMVIVTTRTRAFTLVELMVVVLILGALAFVAIPRMGESVTNAKAKTCRENIRNLNAAIELKYLENGSYSNDLHVISKDANLFPDGQPVCPISNSSYPRWLNATNRVNDSEHSH